MVDEEREAVRAFVKTWAGVQYFRGRYRQHADMILYGAILMAQELLGSRRGVWLAHACNGLGVPPKDPDARERWVNGKVRQLLMQMPNEADEEDFG